MKLLLKKLSKNWIAKRLLFARGLRVKGFLLRKRVNDGRQGFTFVMVI